jgi:hypothetical protein
VSSPLTISWKNSTIAYATQKALRRTSFVRSTSRSSTSAPAIPTTTATV